MRNKILIHFFLIFSLAFGKLEFANAKAPNAILHQEVYEGTIGNSPVVFEFLNTISSNEGKIHAARYFYKKHRLILNLIPDKNIYHEVLKNCTEVYAECKANAKLDLRKTKNGYQGIWKQGTKILNINLVKIETKSYNLDQVLQNQESLYDIYSEAYYDIKNNGFYKRQLMGETYYSKETIINYIGYKTAFDKATNINYPILSRFPNAVKMNKINELLAFQRMLLVSYGLDCKALDKDMSPASGTLGDWDDYQSKITYINENYMLITEAGSTYCGGAHPNNSYSHRMFDLINIREVKASDLINYKLPIKDGEYRSDNTKEYDALLKRISGNPKYRLEIMDKDFEKDCFDGMDTEYSLSFNEKGLMLSLTDLPHVMGACMGDYYNIPYKEIENLLTAKGRELFKKQLSQ